MESHYFDFQYWFFLRCWTNCIFHVITRFPHRHNLGVLTGAWYYHSFHWAADASLRNPGQIELITIKSNEKDVAECSETKEYHQFNRKNIHGFADTHHKTMVWLTRIIMIRFWKRHIQFCHLRRCVFDFGKHLTCCKPLRTKLTSIFVWQWNLLIYSNIFPSYEINCYTHWYLLTLNIQCGIHLFKMTTYLSVLFLRARINSSRLGMYIGICYGLLVVCWGETEIGNGCFRISTSKEFWRTSYAKCHIIQRNTIQ